MVDKHPPSTKQTKKNSPTDNQTNPWALDVERYMILSILTHDVKQTIAYTADTYLEKQNCVKVVLFQLPPLSHSLQKSS